MLWKFFSMDDWYFATTPDGTLVFLEDISDQTTFSRRIYLRAIQMFAIYGHGAGGHRLKITTSYSKISQSEYHIKKTSVCKKPSCKATLTKTVQIISTVLPSRSSSHSRVLQVPH
ncbi:hypothetical protein NPIL_484981 [Nephila pilipes]|uniref:Uncharacterized protein n=1 Tax=Nephila pilipes TaxID=299642 RepID=A0A8X6PPX5_NEPPI|nr:hypothetical protein NPIL_484981 [Nephila pilipes]